MSRSATAAVVVALAIGVGSSARAGEGALRDGTFSASLMLIAHYDHAADPAAVGDLQHVGTVGARLRGMIGKRPGWCGGFDFELGGADEGFAYDAHLYLAGLGARLGGSGMIAVCAGAGLGGITGAVPFAGQFPIEAVFELDLGPVRVMTWARATWTAGSDRRADSAGTIEFADELSAGGGLRIGKRMRPFDDVDAGNGYYVGITYRESMGTELWGAVLGYGFAGAAN